MILMNGSFRIYDMINIGSKKVGGSCGPIVSR